LLFYKFKKNLNEKVAANSITRKPESSSSESQTNKIVLNSLTNPVLVYVKILMTLFLVMIHLKLKFFSEKISETKIESKKLVYITV